MEHPKFTWERRNGTDLFLAAMVVVGFSKTRQNGRESYLPTAEEIAAECHEIQKTWDKREELIRRTGTNRRVDFDLRPVKSHS